MNSDYARQLLDFHYWARDRVVEAAGSLASDQYSRALGSSFSSVRETLNHSYLAEWIWHSRWSGVSPTSFPPDDIADLATLRERWSATERDVRTFVADAGTDGLARVVPYRLLNGTESASPLWQMIAHVVNHASYHRGQVTTMLRQLGARPPRSTDMITWFREQSAPR